MTEFVLSEEPVRYWWPVTVNIPHPDKPGELLMQELHMLFEAEGQDAAVQRQEDYQSLTTNADRVEAEKQHLLAVCHDWKGVVDKDKRPVPFGEANLRRALQQSWFRIGVYTAQAESLNGQAARKN